MTATHELSCSTCNLHNVELHVLNELPIAPVPLDGASYIVVAHDIADDKMIKVMMMTMLRELGPSALLPSPDRACARRAKLLM